MPPTVPLNSRNACKRPLMVSRNETVKECGLCPRLIDNCYRPLLDKHPCKHTRTGPESDRKQCDSALVTTEHGICTGKVFIAIRCLISLATEMFVICLIRVTQKILLALCAGNLPRTREWNLGLRKLHRQTFSRFELLSEYTGCKSLRSKRRDIVLT